MVWSLRQLGVGHKSERELNKLQPTKSFCLFCFGMLHTKCRDSTVSKHARSCGEAVSKTGRAEVACKSFV